MFRGLSVLVPNKNSSNCFRMDESDKARPEAEREEESGLEGTDDGEEEEWQTEDEEEEDLEEELVSLCMRVTVWHLCLQ